PPDVFVKKMALTGTSLLSGFGLGKVLNNAATCWLVAMSESPTMNPVPKMCERCEFLSERSCMSSGYFGVKATIEDRILLNMSLSIFDPDSNALSRKRG